MYGWLLIINKVDSDKKPCYAKFDKVFSLYTK